MKRLIPLLLAAATRCGCRPAVSDYAIVAGPGIADDPAWSEVVAALRQSHPGAALLSYTEAPDEALPALRELAPRYVAFVDRPEQLGRDYIIALNRMDMTPKVP